MTRAVITLLGFALVPTIACSCGLDWTLPQNHFDGVEESGYVEFWEKIGEVDLGDGLIIPVNVSFNSHMETSSPYLGKGWMVSLLESRVAPVNENCMSVIMPDGWTFTFLRNGSTETWRGNAGWVGQTNNTIFTISAPCGWGIKFDGGKIQEIDSNKGQTLSYKYNGPVAVEVDVNGKAFVQVESNASTGVVTDLLIGGQKIELSMAQRPRIMSNLNQNLVTGFDQSLSQLRWPDGEKESFAFGTDKSLNPTLAITHADQTQRNFTWDATTRQIKTDGEWTYNLMPGDNVALKRSNKMGQIESYSTGPGITIEQGIDGVQLITHRFVGAGLLRGKIRKKELINQGVTKIICSMTYDELGHIVRKYELVTDNSKEPWREIGEFFTTYQYNITTGRLLRMETKDKKGIAVDLREYSQDGALTKDIQNGLEVISSKNSDKIVTASGQTKWKVGKDSNGDWTNISLDQ